MATDTTQRILKLYQCSAPNNELHKDKWLTGERIISPYIPKDGNSISNPHIIIRTFEDTENPDRSLLAYNYCYIDDYQRYYFIEDMILLPQGQVELVCKVDVLYSFKNSISKLVIQESRATNGTSNYLIDEKVATQTNAKPKIYQMSFKNDGKYFNGGFNAQDYENIPYIVKMFTKIDYNGDVITGKSTNALCAASNALIDDSDYTPPADMSAQQKLIADAIPELAHKLYEGYDNYMHPILSSVVNNYAKYYFSCAYSQNVGEMVDGAYTWKTPANPVTSQWKYGNKKCYIIDSGLNNTQEQWQVTRFDSAFCDGMVDADGNTMRQDQVVFNGTTRQTKLNIVTESKINTWNANHPTDTIPSINQKVWNGWDCSSFAWRMCLFGKYGMPIDINSTVVGSGIQADTGSELAFLSNHGCLVCNAGSKRDLEPGDLIFSGHQDSSDHSWIGLKNGTWVQRYKVHEDPNDPNSPLVPPDVSDLTDVISVNHVRIYWKNNYYFDVTGNTDDEDKGSDIEKSGNIHRGTLGDIKAIENKNNTKVIDLIEGTDKHIRICRPCLLWGSVHQT